MAFAGSNLSLSTVCTAYGVSPQKLASLAGSVYYTNGGVSTGTTVFLPVNLYVFAGRYISSNGTLSNTAGYPSSGNFYEEAFAQAGTAGHGIEARGGWSGLTYTMTSNKLTSVSLNFYLNANGTGTSYGEGTNNKYITITVDGTNYVRPEGTGSFSPTIIPGSSTFKIRVQGNASNGWGDQASADKTWNFTISNVGITPV
jgi:hypothetical protein